MGGILAVARMIRPFWGVNSMMISVKLCFLCTGGQFIVGILEQILGWNRCKPYYNASYKVVVVATYLYKLW